VKHGVNAALAVTEIVSGNMLMIESIANEAVVVEICSSLVQNPRVSCLRLLEQLTLEPSIRPVILTHLERSGVATTEILVPEPDSKNYKRRLQWGNDYKTDTDATFKLDFHVALVRLLGLCCSEVSIAAEIKLQKLMPLTSLLKALSDSRHTTKLQNSWAIVFYHYVLNSGVQPPLIEWFDEFEQLIAQWTTVLQTIVWKDLPGTEENIERRGFFFGNCVCLYSHFRQVFLEQVLFIHGWQLQRYGGIC